MPLRRALMHAAYYCHHVTPRYFAALPGHMLMRNISQHIISMDTPCRLFAARASLYYVTRHLIKIFDMPSTGIRARGKTRARCCLIASVTARMCAERNYQH